jgi:hypothetical protein
LENQISFRNLLNHYSIKTPSSKDESDLLISQKPDLISSTELLNQVNFFLNNLISQSLDFY